MFPQEGLSDSMIQHEFIAIDEGHATLLHINEREGLMQPVS